MARPKIQIDEKLVEQLAMIQCTPAEIGSIVGCSLDTILNRFSKIIEKGKINGRMSIRRAQFKKATEGNVVMLIWLGKQYLHQSDIPENGLSDKEIQVLKEKAVELMKERV